ncbi:MAG TPA: tetratricopeptide repeat protein, partial [Candidatus Limnocylindrales bacterium]|nr:tetratricopeptide repeat protein [Candidatus Limnocylindrales bacterium]
LLGLRHPDREGMLEAAGRIALAGDAPRFGEARRLLGELLLADADLWEAHFALGLLARREGDPEAAERSFRAALERWPEQPDALHELGVALLLRDAVAEAVAVLERAAALRPEDAAYLADAGYARLRGGDVAVARRHLERSRALAPEDQITATYLAELARVESEEQPPVRPN